MFALLAKIPFRLYEYAGLALAVILFVLWWDHKEIEKGRFEIRKEIALAQAKAQASIDAAADEQNAKLQAQFNAHNYSPIDYTLPQNCNGKVPESVRDAVNKAHQQ